MRSGFFGALLFLAATASAAGPDFRAEVDRETLSLDDSLLLTLRISGQLSQVPGLELGELPDFEVFPRGQQQRMSVVNGAMTVESIQQFELRPRRSGELRISAFSVVVDGSTYTTQPISVTVTEIPSAPAGPSPPARPDAGPSGTAEVELQATANPAQVYVGQQLSYQLRVFRRVQWDSPGLDPVKFDGFWVEELGNPGAEKRISANGQIYLYQDLLYALFPSTPGTRQLEPRTLRYSRITEADRFFAIPRPAPPVHSNAVDIEVLPIPQDSRPPQFSGAVGTLEITAKVDRPQTAQDQAVTLTLIVSGVGNPNTFPQPALDLPAALEAFETQADVYVNKKRELISGSHTFKTVLVPRASGEFKLGPFELWTFDPFKKSFAHVRSDEVTLSVEKGKAVPGVAAVGGTARQEDLRLLGEDIRYLKPLEATYSGSVDLLVQRPSFWFLVAVPIAFLVAIALLERHRNRLSTDVEFRRRRQALRNAKDRLGAAARIQDKAEQPRLLEHAILGYLCDWFGLSPTGSSTGEIEARLREAAVSKDLLGSLNQFLAECSRTRFAGPGEGNNGIPDGLVSKAHTLLAELRREVASR